MEMKGTVALVTGGARRVGRAIVLELARGGCDIVVHYGRSEVDASAVREAVESLGRRCWLVSADLANMEAVEAMLLDLARLVPPVDVLVNSASIFPCTPIQDLTVDAFDRILAVNLRAPFMLARHFGLQMKSQGRGKIINIADSAVQRPYRHHAPYLISKAALEAATRVLALELAPEVQVNTVAPGTVLLPEGAPAGLEAAIVRRTPLARTGSPGEVAAMVRHLVESGDFATGGTYVIDGGVAI